MPSTKQLLQRAYEHAATPFVDLFDFAGQTCVVTGGAKGIGLAIVRRFVELGARVVVVDVDSAATAVEGATGIVGDVCDSAFLDEVAATAIEGNPSRLIWVNCAGIYPTNMIDEMSDADWAKVIDLDLTATFYGCRSAALAMRGAAIGGVIVNLSSVAGFRVGNPPGLSHYAAAKHGVQGLTKALAVELGSDGIRVCAIAPGTVITEGLIEKFGPVDPEGVSDRFSQSAQRMPIKRPSLPDDVARAAVFLASPAADQLTGTIIPVDAGHLAL